MKKHKLRLGVNIDHVATIREARKTVYPDVVAAAQCCEKAGADGVTIHLREDRRHIKDNDVFAVKKAISIPLNLEMSISPEIVRIALDAHPDETCLVPEKRQELTTEGGLDIAGNKSTVFPVVILLREAGIAVSIFIDPDFQQVETAAESGAQYVELHTGTYCNLSGDDAKKELDKLINASIRAHSIGLRVNAGHGINLANINGILEIPYLDTLNIGHSIVSEAIFKGLAKAVKEMRNVLKTYKGGRL